MKANQEESDENENMDSKESRHRDLVEGQTGKEYTPTTVKGRQMANMLTSICCLSKSNATDLWCVHIVWHVTFCCGVDGMWILIWWFLLHAKNYYMLVCIVFFNTAIYWLAWWATSSIYGISSWKIMSVVQVSLLWGFHCTELFMGVMDVL